LPGLFSFVVEFRKLSDEERLPLPPRASVGRPRIDDRLVVTGYYMCLLLDDVGWISPLGMAHIRPAEISLISRVLWAYGLRFLKPS
jgi:hypothetical protein